MATGLQAGRVQPGQAEPIREQFGSLDSALRRYEEVWEEFIGPDGCGSSALRTYGQRCIQERMPHANHDWAAWYLQTIKDSATQIVITPGGGGFGGTAGKQ